MKIMQKAWLTYVQKLTQVNKKAGDLMREYIEKHGTADRAALIEYAKALIDHYGEAAGAQACMMYDETARTSGTIVQAAEIAELPDYDEVAKMVNGTLKQSPAGNITPSGVSRLLKRVGADTTLKNALRGGA